MAHTILVVDDAPEVCELIKAMLEAHDYSVVTASDGNEGLRITKELKPSLILADILMPGMDGFVFFKELKKDESTAKIPVIILTARARMEDSFRVLGVDSFLAKPIDANKLLKEVETLLAGKAADAQQGDITETPVFAEEQELSAEDLKKGKKVLIFGINTETVRNMTDQLRKEYCRVHVVESEKNIVNEVSVKEPDLILLELTGDTMMPLDQIVFSLSDMIRKKADEFGPVLYNPVIVLYRVEEERGGISSLSEELADAETLLQRCYDSGRAKYIGVYSAISFLFKIKVFLN